MAILLSLDGLSYDDLVQLMDFLPRSERALGALRKHSIESIHSEAHPLWGELLTGCHWYDSGCYGYAAIDESVNKLRAFDERQLMRPLWLENNQVHSVVINVPILLPNTRDGRIWLADGSLPNNRVVSPVSLRDQKIFADYVPRAYHSQRVAKGSLVQLARECINVEERRLACALELFRQGSWKNFVYRVSLFDHLFHLFGHQNFANERLGFSESLRAFLIKFDHALSSFLSSESAPALALVSVFSHVPCRGMINLNDIFLRMGWLTKARSETAHRRAFGIESTGIKQSSHNFTSYDGCIDSRSIVSSPVSGSVFINRKSTVQYSESTPTDPISIRTRIQAELLSGFKDFVPQFENNPNLNHDGLMPDFIVKLDGVGYHNMMPEEVATSDFPASVHSSKGFALLSPQFEKKEITSPAMLGKILAAMPAF